MNDFHPLIDSGKTSLVEQIIVDLRALEDASFRREPQRNHESHESGADHGHITHVLRCGGHGDGKTVDDVEEHDPKNGGGVDGRAVSAQAEVARWEDLVSTTVEEDGLRDDAGGLEEDDGAADHG